MTDQTHSPFDGEANDPSSFHLLVSQDDAMRARWDAISATVIAHASEIGVQITKTDVASMPSARLAVLVGEPMGEHYERELANLPAVQAEKKKIALREKLQAGDERAQAEVARMRPADRMSFARQNGLTGAAPRAPQSADDEAAQIRMLLALPAAARISAARRMGFKV